MSRRLTRAAKAILALEEERRVALEAVATTAIAWARQYDHDGYDGSVAQFVVLVALKQAAIDFEKAHTNSRGK